jgi:deazaflavin-dependent oxidoreductase (nitroreductase family)
MRGIAIRIGSLSWLPTLLPQITAFDKFLQARSKGRWSILRMACLPGVMLMIPGRKSGIIRSTPVLCVPYEGGVLVAGSNFGGPKPPLWVNNLRAAERPEMMFGGETTVVTAAELSDVDRDRAWAAMLALWPNYAKYASRTDRLIPVFHLQPTA